MRHLLTGSQHTDAQRTGTASKTASIIDGQADAANQRITDAPSTRDTEPGPGGGEDGEGEMAP